MVKVESEELKELFGNPAIGFTYGKLGVSWNAPIQNVGSIIIHFKDKHDEEEERHIPFGGKVKIKRWKWRSKEQIKEEVMSHD